MRGLALKTWEFSSEIFGASKVMELTGCKPTAATSLIKKLLFFEIIEPVTGHGKGKYRAKG